MRQGILSGVMVSKLRLARQLFISSILIMHFISMALCRSEAL